MVEPSRKTINRHESIRRALDWHQKGGVIRSWTASSPMGKRWVVDLFSVGTRVLTTREVEVLLMGLAAEDYLKGWVPSPTWAVADE